MSETLTLRQEKFAAALTDPTSPTFCRPSATYRAISPGIAPGTDRVGAVRMLANHNVRNAIRGQLGLQQLGSKLKRCLRETEKLKDWAEVRATVMDYARLTGQFAEKREITVVSEQDFSVIRELVNQSMSNNKHSVKLPESHN